MSTIPNHYNFLSKTTLSSFNLAIASSLMGRAVSTALQGLQRTLALIVSKKGLAVIALLSLTILYLYKSLSLPTIGVDLSTPDDNRNTPATNAASQNESILKSIASEGILTKGDLIDKAYLWSGSNDEISDRRMLGGISTNFIYRGVTENEELFKRCFRLLVCSPARGINHLLLERSDKNKQKTFYNLAHEEFSKEVTQRIEASVLFALNIQKLPEHTSRGVAYDRILELASIGLTGEISFDRSIPADAIKHVFIPKAIQEIATQIFSHYPISIVENIEDTLHLMVPDGLEIKPELLDGDDETKKFMPPMRTVQTQVPNYKKAITDYTFNHFAASGEPIVLHLTRLFVEQDLST